jgi:hypothetical protein
MPTGRQDRATHGRNHELPTVSSENQEPIIKELATSSIGSEMQMQLVPNRLVPQLDRGPAWAVQSSINGRSRNPPVQSDASLTRPVSSGSSGHGTEERAFRPLRPNLRRRAAEASLSGEEKADRKHRKISSPSCRCLSLHRTNGRPLPIRRKM